MAIHSTYPHWCVVYIAEQIVGQRLSLAAVGDHSALLEQDDSIDFGWNLVEMVGDDDDILALISKATDLP